jgi:protein-disulfide isomerase
MSSRKAQREPARVARFGAQRAHALRERRSRRLRTVSGALLVAATLVAVAISISEHNPRKPTERQIDLQVSALLAGVPQRATTLGDPQAPIAVTYFGDLECAVCRAFTVDGGFPQLVADDVRQGRVKVVYRSLCTATCSGPGESVFDTQQAAAYAAGRQDLFWDYAELFYQEQGEEDSGYVTESYLDRLAAQVPGLDAQIWHADRGAPALLAQVRADAAAASKLGVMGTPTLIVAGPGGTQAVSAGVPSYSDLEQSIRRVS